jgi:hypothetical protein
MVSLRVYRGKDKVSDAFRVQPNGTYAALKAHLERTYSGKLTLAFKYGESYHPVPESMLARQVRSLRRRWLFYASPPTEFPLPCSQVEDTADLVAWFHKSDTEGESVEYSIPPRPHHILQDVSPLVNSGVPTIGL